METINQHTIIRETNIDKFFIKNNEVINISNKLDLENDTMSVTSVNSILSNQLMLKTISNNILDKSTIEDKVEDKIEDKIEDNIEDKVEDNIEDKVEDKNELIINYLNDTLSNFEKQNEKSKAYINTNANVTFTNSELNDIKSYSINGINGITNFNNDNDNDNLSSINSESDINYINSAKKQKPIEIIKINKNIICSKNKKNKNKNIHNDASELDEIDYLYNKLQDYIRYMKIDRTNYIIIIAKSMEYIENYHTTNEIDKKATVIKALTRIVNIDLYISNFDKKLFLLSMNNIIEIIIICSKINKKQIIKDESINYESINYESINYENVRNDFNNNELVFASSGQIIHSLIDKLTTIIIKKQYNADKLFVNICTITDILMILVNKNIYLINIEKKNIIIQAFTKFVVEKIEYLIDLDKIKKNELIFALESVPVIIDLLISLQNGKFKINNKTNKTNKTKHKSFINKLLNCM